MLQAWPRISCRIRPGCSSVMGSTRRPCGLGQLLQGAHRHADVQRQRHPRRQQTVAAEQRHEPRRTGRHEGRAIFGVVVDQQRAQVALAAAQDLRQRGMLGVQLGRGVPPRLELVRRAARLLVLAAPEPGRHVLICPRRLDHNLGLPGLPRRDHDPPIERTRQHDRIPGRRHRHAPNAIGALGQDELVVPHRHVRTAQRRPTFLDREQIREVGVGVQHQRHHGALVVKVVQPDGFPQPVGDEPLPDQQQRAVGQSGARGTPQNEFRHKRFRGLHRQRLGRLAVDPQLPPRQHPGVADEQTMRASGQHVATPVGQAKRGAIYQRHRLTAEPDVHGVAAVERGRRTGHAVVGSATFDRSRSTRRNMACRLADTAVPTTVR